MPDERYLKEITAELRLIRKELQRMNNPLERTTCNLETLNIETLNIRHVNESES